MLMSFPIAALLLLLAAFTSPLGASTLAPHAPSLMVHETAYGITTHDGHRESNQSIEMRIVSRHEPRTTYQVQCFFIKKGKSGSPATIDDTVLFGATDPHGTYRVMARPIALGKAPFSSGTGGSKKKPSSKSSSPSKPADSSADYPREGYLVRILHDGIVLREHASSPQIERLAKEESEFFEKAAFSKKTRHEEGTSLLVH